MSLQERINRSRREWLAGDREVSLDEHIAAGLERDYHLVKLADLPRVRTLDNGLSGVEGEGAFRKLVASDIPFYEEKVHEYLAYIKHLQMVKDLINRLISANADHTRAGEGDV